MYLYLNSTFVVLTLVDFYIDVVFIHFATVITFYCWDSFNLKVKKKNIFFFTTKPARNTLRLSHRM